MTETWDTIVIGGGPAGLSSALMLGRSRRRVLVVDSGSPRNRFAAHMHGVLGNEGAGPADFVERGRAECREYGVEFREGAIESVSETESGLAVALSGSPAEPERTRAVVVATGVTDELASIPGLAERWGRDVLHCPYCHGWEVRDRRLGVLVASAANLHMAYLIRQLSEDVTVFSPEELPEEVSRRMRARGVRLAIGEVAEVLADGDRMLGVRTADGRTTPIDALFTGAALRPRDGFLAGLDLARVPGPFGGDPLLSVDAAGRTSNPRIWAVGNVVNPMANVPMSIGAGSLTGGAVNGALAEEDFDQALETEAARV